MTPAESASSRKVAMQQQQLHAIAKRIAAGHPPADILAELLSIIHVHSGAHTTHIEHPYGALREGARFSEVDNRYIRNFLYQMVDEYEVFYGLANADLGQAGAHFDQLGIGFHTVWPLRVNNNLRGVLWMGHLSPPTLSEVELQYMEMLSTQAALLLGYHPAEDMQAIVSALRDGVILLDENLVIRAINPSADFLFDVQADQALGLVFDDVVSNQDLIRYTRGLTGVLAKRFFITHKEHIYQPIVTDIMLTDGTRGKLVVLTDVNHFKRMNENMTIFLQTVSHDLRSPLTAAKGFLDMMPMVGDLTSEQTRMREKILTSINDMTNLVEKVLDAGRLDPEMGAYELRRDLCEPGRIAEKVVSTLATSAEKKGILLTSDVGSDLPTLNVDEMMLERALTNLVENAIKYTPQGGQVVVSAFVRGNNLHLCVEDNGYGISPEMQRKLFDKGVRIRRDEHKAIRGSGLGLFIVKNVAQQHDGNALIDSVEGEGSLFSIIIPIAGANVVGAG